MNIWLKYVDEVIVVAPLSSKAKTAIETTYLHPKLHLETVPAMQLKTVISILRSIYQVPLTFLKIIKVMKSADHIHLRCPGNIGLLGCIAQIFFPKKLKTAKYAGNWDPKSKQPLTYRLQRYILNNTFLTKNMRVLVYGEWPRMSANIKPFFTATYAEADKMPIPIKAASVRKNFLFVGSLSSGKRPMYATEVVRSLHDSNYDVSLDIYGDGAEYQILNRYIFEHKLSNIITLHGNQDEMIVREAYKSSHYLILPSKSEGWPKAVAEAMFWGCVPVASQVSCVPYMLDSGKRGVLLEMDMKKDVDQIKSILDNYPVFEQMSADAIRWSREYTLDKFETEITKLLAQ
jgi:glycosyltransferase involved in cell wall biosynthesis